MDKEYNQYQIYLKQYSEFVFSKKERTVYYRDPNNVKFLEEHKSRGVCLCDTSIGNVAKLCRLIRLFTVGRNVTVLNPFIYNGIQLMGMCLEGNKLNCAGCSVVLNDILITQGFKSKCICCIPFDPHDMDKNVLFHVYDETVKSWFVADPAMGCVPCDSSGRGLDILQLREFLAQGKELYFYQSGMIVRDCEKRKNYAEMLAKNMVMFIVFFSSGLHYCMEKSRMIIPLGITDISSLYSASEKTNNSFYLYY